MIKFSKDQQALTLPFDNDLEVNNLSDGPQISVSCETEVNKEVSDSCKLPVFIHQTLTPPKRKESSDSDLFNGVFNVESDTDKDSVFTSFRDQLDFNSSEHKESRETYLSDDSFENHYEDSFDFDWSESDCSYRPLLAESENLTFVTTGKEERDHIDGVEFVTFETERDMVEYTKIDVDFKGVEAASQSDDGLEMLDDGSISDFNSSHTIVPRKTKDITKIKGWMNKRFALVRNSDDESRTSQKSDDGYDDGFESSCMRNVEEASSDERESTKMSDKLDTLLDPIDAVSNASNAEGKSSCTFEETSTSKIVSPSISKSEQSSWSSTKSEYKSIRITENNFLPSPMKNGSNPHYKRRVSQSLIDSISNKIKSNYAADEREESPQKRPFSEAFISESESTPSKKPNTKADKGDDYFSFSEGIEQTSSNSKSAFVSDALEEFLKNQSKLNIHYELPQLKAAENITHSEQDLMPIRRPAVISRPRITTTPMHFNGYKPKTLAEKRRMLEKGDYRSLVGESSSSSSSNVTPYNPIVNRRKRPKHEMIKLNSVMQEGFAHDMKSVQSTSGNATKDTGEGNVYERKAFRSSKRISSGGFNKVPSPSVSESVELNRKIRKKNEPIFKKKCIKFKKPCFGDRGEIQNCSPVPLHSRIKRNSPLESCTGEGEMAKELIFSSSNLKDKVGMILHVGLGRPLYEEAAHNLELLKGDNLEISKNFASFAAAAVLPDGLNIVRGTKILVPVVCKKLIDLINQTNNTVKKKCKITSKSVTVMKNIQQNKTPTACVSDGGAIRYLMNDLLHYISSKDSFESCTYDFDPDVPMVEDTDKDVQINEEDLNIKTTKQKEKSKLNMQLKKIGVTFIDITDETKNEEPSDNGPQENKICLKDFCKLGCVCDSLKVKDKKQDHCGRVSCMFQCKCRKSMLVKSMTAQGNVTVKYRLWMTATVRQLQHERDLNLAKEEREYHQTVIRDKDKVIMMTSNKKRAIKLPNKYKDSEVFLNKDFSIEQLEKAFNFPANNDMSIAKVKKKSMLDEQKKKEKGINRTIAHVEENPKPKESFDVIKPCTVVLNKDAITNYNRSMLWKHRRMLNYKPRLRRRNVAIKRTGALSVNDLKKRSPTNKTTKNDRNVTKNDHKKTANDKVIFIQDSSDDEGQSQPKMGNIHKVFTLKERRFSTLSESADTLNENPQDTISNKSNTFVSREYHNMLLNLNQNESVAPLPKMLAPSRYLVIELVDDLFTALKYQKYGVSVSYENLKEAIRQAEVSNKTIRMIFPSQKKKNPKLSDSTKYGAYAVPGLDKDMIFFGPYDLNEEHGLHGQKRIGNNIITIPFVKKDSHERNKVGIRYQWWVKNFQKSIIKPMNTNSTDTKCTGSSSKIVPCENIVVNQQTKKRKRRKTKAQKRLFTKQKTGTPVVDRSLNENTSDKPLNVNVLTNQQLNDEPDQNKGTPLIRVRSDLMANPGFTVKCPENKATPEFGKKIIKKRKSVTNSTKEPSIIEAVANVPKKNNEEFHETPDTSSNDCNEESDGDLDVFLYQPIGAVNEDDTRKGNRFVKNKNKTIYQLDERLFKDPLEQDVPTDEVLPMAGLICLTPGIGYIPVCAMNCQKLSIQNPFDGKMHSFSGILEASKYFHQCFKARLTFEPEDFKLKWVVVKPPLLKRLRPFDKDILNNSSLIVTPDGVVEVHTHGILVERNKKEKRRRQEIVLLAKELGKLFVDEDQLGRMPLKGILDTAVTIIQKVNEISVNNVVTLNKEKDKKARLQARLKVLKAERCLSIVRQRVEKAKKNEEKLTIGLSKENQETINPADAEAETPCVEETSDKEDFEPIQVSSSPESVSVVSEYIRRKPPRQGSQVIHITVSSDEENSKDNCIELSDSDSVEITGDSSHDQEATTNTPEIGFAGCITPPNSSPLISLLSKSPLVNPNPSILKDIETEEVGENILPDPVGTVNQALADQPKPSWYIAPEEPAPKSSVPKFSLLDVNNTNKICGKRLATLPKNTFAFGGKTVLVRQNDHGGVELSRPPNSMKKLLSPIQQPQSNSTKGSPIVLNKSPVIPKVIGIITLNRDTALPDSNDGLPVAKGTANLFKAALKDPKPTRVFKPSSSSILKSNLNQGNQPNSLTKQNAQGFIKLNQNFKISANPALMEDSSSEDNDDFSDSPSTKSTHRNNSSNEDHLYLNRSSGRPVQSCNSPSSSSKSESSSSRSTPSKIKSTLNAEKDKQIIDSVVLKGPKLHYPKPQNSSKGVKVLRPVEKH